MTILWNMRASDPLTLPAAAALVASILVACATEEAPPVDICDESPGALYEKRVAPLFAADHPDTCSQCHAGGIDLGALMREDPCESMACLLAEGLVDLNFPERSVILAWIDRAQPDSNLITPAIIEEEHQGFLTWIEHESLCGLCSDAVCTGRPPSLCDNSAELGGAYNSLNDPGDCESETMERLFRGTVYESRWRCSPCHFQEEETADASAPRWLSRTGDCKVASLSSFRAVVEFGYLNIESPKDSLLLLKPLAEGEGGIPHGGHDKFSGPEEDSFQEYLHFAERYSACEIAQSL